MEVGLHTVLTDYIAGMEDIPAGEYLFAVQYLDLVDTSNGNACLLYTSTREKQCVIASRYQPGARAQGPQASRKLFSDGARLYYTLVLHVPGVKDYTCGYRVYTLSLIHI